MGREEQQVSLLVVTSCTYKRRVSRFFSQDRRVRVLAYPLSCIETDFGGGHRDLAQLEKMRLLGMKAEDEYKLTAMREYVSKLAAARQR